MKWFIIGAVTKRSRTVLFLLLGAFFLVGAPAIILYSQGYRFHWQEKWFSQVGAFYLNVTPTRAEVLIDGKSIGRTAPFLGTTLTKNFSPGSYRIQIQKVGYRTWEKHLEVFPKQVTEAKYITLLPEDPAFVLLQDRILAFWPAPNETEAILQKSSGPASARNTWTLLFWNTQRNTEYPLYESRGFRDELQNIEWAADSNSFVFHIASGEQIQSFVQEIDRSSLAQQNTREDWLQGAAQLRQPFLPNPLAQGAVAFLAQNTRQLRLDQNGILWEHQNGSAQAVQLNQTAFPLRTESLYAIVTLANEIFLQENQTLYVLNRQTQSFEEFFVAFQEMVLSPDQKKLALSNGKEIWLYFLQEDREQPSRAKGEMVFLTRFSEDISNLAWLNSHYLLFARGDLIMVSEIDNRDQLNIGKLASFSAPAFFWQGATKTLFVHASDQIRASEKLLP